MREKLIMDHSFYVKQITTLRNRLCGMPHTPISHNISTIYPLISTTLIVYYVSSIYHIGALSKMIYFITSFYPVLQ